MTTKDDEGKLLRSTALQNANSILIARQRTEQRKEFYLAEGQRLAHMGSWAFNPSGVFEYWSPELFQIYGFDPAKGAPTLNEYLATVHPQDREFIARTIEKMLLQGSGCDVKQRILRPDGEIRHIRWVGVPVFEEGVFKGFVGTAMDVTEQDHLTQELRRREAYLAEAQRLSHTGSFGWSVLSGEIVWSDETFRIFEYDRTAKPNLELVLQRVHPEDKVLVQQLIDRASQDGKDFDLDFRLLMPSGPIKHLHVVAHAVRDESGNIEFVGAVMDVTERKRVEEALREREKHFRALFENCADAVSLLSPDGTILFTTASTTRSLGYSVEEFVGRSAFELVHPKDAERNREIFERLLQTPNEVVAGRYRYRHKDGSWRWFEGVGKNLLADSSVRAIVVTFRDITERKRAEDKLRQSEEQFRLISENVADLIAVVDLEGRRVYNSPSYKAILGDPEELHGTLSFNEIHPDDRDNIKRVFEETVRTGVGQRSGYRFLLKDGSVRFIESQGSVIRDRQGKPANVVVVSRDITERKRVEEALRRSEEQYRLMFESNPNAMWICDLESFRFLQVNDAAINLYGYSREEFLAMNLKDIRPAEDIPGLMENVTNVRRGLVQRATRKHRKKDGKIIDVETTAYPIQFEGRLAALVLPLDITERKRIEDRERNRSLILESLTAGETLDTILDSIARAIEMEDPTALCTILLLDKEGKHLLHGAAPSMPRFFIDAVDGIEIGEAIGSCGAAAYTKQRVVAEDLSIHPYWLPYRDLTQKADLKACWSEPILAANGRVLGTFGIYYRTPRSPDANDVKRIKYASDLARLAIEHKQAEAEKTRLVTAIEQSVEAVVITNASGGIEYVNPAFTGITGYSRAEVQGQNLRILKSGKQDPASYQQLWATILKGEIWRGELINRRKDGKLYTEELNIAPVRGERGEITHFIATKQDVTERKHLEEQFRQAQKMELVGQLAGGVAHDFNNLLTVINGYSEVMLEQLPPDDPCHGYADEIKKAGDRAASLTHQLLAFSRRQVLKPQVLDLNYSIAKMEKMLRRLIGEDIDLAIVRDSALGRAKADPGQIEQILMNLAINARDAMPEGGKLAIETANVELDDAYGRSHASVSPGRYVMLAVSDSGIGMDAETQAHIFEPFFTTKEKDKGTGLGLATVYGIVKQSGGHIWVYSEPGRGTAFKIYLPRVERVDESVPALEARGHSVTGTETILLVEDEEAVRSLAARALQDLGYKVLESTSPEDALQIGERHEEPIDLLLTDVVMPRMSGRKVAEHLALLRPGMKVIYMSGYTDDAIVRHGVLEAGIAFLQKPFTPAALARKVREVLDAEPSLIPRVARLVFDSFRQSPLAGVRSEGPLPRHCVYRSGSMQIDIWTEPAEQALSVALMGQVLDQSGTVQAVKDMVVKLRRKDAEISTTTTNQFGEFHLVIGQPTETDLQLTLGDYENIAVLIPLRLTGDAQGGQ